ncbi:hypothetical protein L596_004646 [Steinernema carpocapsae]|uniref:Uncharacterized protein n=1 Tax=Steinernema carpocapsae TaxID=34508 RepID=A0A4U8UXI7_STECR|nr:hypothetical protein L596_004646 [Steinernema carpocapsae]
MTPITTHGYMKGVKEKKTIVRMHQPKTGCDKNLTVVCLGREAWDDGACLNEFDQSEDGAVPHQPAALKEAKKLVI